MRFINTFIISLLLSFIASLSYGQVIIGTGSSTQEYPFNYYYGYGRDASVYTAAEMNTVTTGGTITTISWNSSLTSGFSTGSTTIYLKTIGSATTVPSANWSTQISGATTVYTGTPTWSNGVNTIDITDFPVPANSNLMILIQTDYGGTGTGSTGGNSYRYTVAHSNSHAYWEADNSPPTGVQNSNNDFRPNVILGGLTPPSPPANDNSAGAIALTGNPNYDCATTLSGSTAYATQSGESAPTCNPTGIDDDVWYKFVATNSNHRVSVSGTSNTITLAAYSGVPGSLVVFGTCNPTSMDLTGLAIGTTYHVRAYTSATAVSSNFVICLGTPPPPPVNDACANATTLACNNTPLNGTTVASVSEPALPGACSSLFGVWYTFTGTGASITISSTAAIGFDHEFVLFSGSCGSLTNITCRDGAGAGGTETYTFNSVSGTTYYVYVAHYDASSTSTGTFTISLTCTIPVPNNEATGAIALTVNNPCSGAFFSNLGATPTSSSSTEPKNGGGDAFKTVWFTFQAPAAGAVRISTDVGGGNTLTDSRIAVYSITNVSDYSTFTCLSSDDDGGSSLGSGLMSVLYVTGLTPGTTYYIQVGTYDASTSAGTFCITVDELNNSMLATTANCSLNPPTIGGINPAYTGWVPVLDSGSKLIALVRNPTGASPNTYSNLDLNIHTGSVRQDEAGKRYLNRNYAIANTTTGPYQLQLFFLTTERNALAAVDPAASSLSNLNVTRDPNVNCLTAPTGNNNELLVQSSGGTSGGVEWIQVNTPSFSGFFINTGLAPLPVNILSFTAKNNTQKSVELSWTVSAEKDVKDYVVEKSVDKINWRTMDNLPATNNNKYASIDRNPSKGINYYRLAVNDLNGARSYSEIRTANFGALGNLSVFPNPATEFLNISGLSDKQVTIAIFNEMGQQVVNSIYFEGNSGLEGINISNLAPGSYIIRLTGQSDFDVVRFVKM